MSLSPSPADSSFQQFVLSSPDRVLVRAIPHPLAPTNKKVTLTLRRSGFNSSQPQASKSCSEPSTTPLNIQSPNSSFTTAATKVTATSPEQLYHFNHNLRHSMSSTLTTQDPSNWQTRCATSNIGQVAHTTHQALSVSVAAAGITKTNTDGTLCDRPPHLVIRKNIPLHKNGLPIKSAMKSPVFAAEVKTSPPAVCRPSSIRSHSMPLMCQKYVHFNTQLEHVRLFLQGETPSCLAERETIVDARQNSRSTSDIKITNPNWTPVPVDSFRSNSSIDDAGTAPLRFEKADLSEDQTELHGKILVQNIAFHKHVSVRYTADFWRTQTEATAEFEGSVPGTSLDRFKFMIPLDMERTQVEKTFCLAIRYQVIGREFWDSNNGMNYQIECKRVVVVAPQQAASSVSDLSKQMNSLLLGTTLPNYTKPMLKKNLANRYDLSTSLSAAYSHPNTIPTRSIPAKMDSSMILTPKVPLPSSQTAYRPSEYITPPSPLSTSPHDHHSLYASSPKFINPYLTASSPPEHFHFGFDQPNLKPGLRNSWNFEIGTSPIRSATPPRTQSFPAGYYGALSSSPKSSAPIAIPSSQRANGHQVSSGHAGSFSTINGRPAVGSSSYFDLVDRYCFYESSPHTSPYNSYPNSPPAPCIRG
ncbi:hypothetical protein BG004_001627 [Podila humilis]|nr:hypothetical protein BG004_001627 [Podila humilis]